MFWVKLLMNCKFNIYITYFSPVSMKDLRNSKYILKSVRKMEIVIRFVIRCVMQNDKQKIFPLFVEKLFIRPSA